MLHIALTKAIDAVTFVCNIVVIQYRTPSKTMLRLELSEDLPASGRPEDQSDKVVELCHRDLQRLIALPSLDGLRVK